MVVKKKQASAPPAKRDPNRLEVTDVTYRSAEERGAMVASSATFRAAVIGRKYAEPIFGTDIDITHYAGELKKQADTVKGGDLSGVEAMLLSQANTLDMIFNQLARKSAHCEYLKQMEANLRLALKAQAQCAHTLKVLGELKNPRQVAFVKQANLGHQVQVNNHAAPPTASRVENSAKSTNELLKHQNGERLDTRATGQTSRSDQTLETVETSNRP